MCLVLEVTGWWESRGLLLGFACTAVFHCKHSFVTVNESILIWVLYFQIWNSFSDCVCFILNKQQHSLIYKVIHYCTKYSCYFFITLEKSYKLLYIYNVIFSFFESHLQWVFPNCNSIVLFNVYFRLKVCKIKGLHVSHLESKAQFFNPVRLSTSCSATLSHIFNGQAHGERKGKERWICRSLGL